MARREAGRLADRRRGAEKDALLAAKKLAFLLSERGRVDVAHAGLDGAHNIGKERVLHLAAALDQADLLRALDRLEAVDELGRIHERRARQALLEPHDKGMRHAARPNEPDGLVTAL